MNLAVNFGESLSMVLLVATTQANHKSLSSFSCMKLIYGYYSNDSLEKLLRREIGTIIEYLLWSSFFVYRIHENDAKIAWHVNNIGYATPFDYQINMKWCWIAAIIAEN